MPSGYDIGDEETLIEQKTSKVSVTVHTWDNILIKGYEALGRSTKEGYVHSRKVMDTFIEKPNIFKPAVIIVDENGTPLRTTRRRLPELTNEIKADMLNYDKNNGTMPITNPAVIHKNLEEEFKTSKYANKSPETRGACDAQSCFTGSYFESVSNDQG
jgi:hypothetical protein